MAQDVPGQAETAAGGEQGRTDPNPTSIPLAGAIPQPSPVQDAVGRALRCFASSWDVSRRSRGGSALQEGWWGCRARKGKDGAPYQVPHTQHVLELLCHGIVLHGHEESVEHDADGDAQVHEGVHHHQLDKLLQLHPRRAAVPDQECVGEFVPPGWAFLVSFFQL